MGKYVFGPVLSRRLGLSLGIDLSPEKTCTWNCLYCQLPAAKTLTSERSVLCPIGDVIVELEKKIGKIEPPDWITFSGTGEPTLHSQIGLLIKLIKEKWQFPICVITNGSLLNREDVINDLMAADRVLPTLTTVFQETFLKLHQPCNQASVEAHLDGLRKFVHIFPGFVELEIFICSGINDSSEEIRGLVDFVSTLENLPAVYLNTVVRPPAMADVKAVSPEKLEEIKNMFPKNLRVTTAYDQKNYNMRATRRGNLTSEEIMALLTRHPSTLNEMEISLGVEPDRIWRHLRQLEKAGKIRKNQEKTWMIVP